MWGGKNACKNSPEEHKTVKVIAVIDFGCSGGARALGGATFSRQRRALPWTHVINVGVGARTPQSEKYSNRKDLVLKISQQPSEANTATAGTFSCLN